MISSLGRGAPSPPYRARLEIAGDVDIVLSQEKSEVGDKYAGRCVVWKEETIEEHNPHYWCLANYVKVTEVNGVPHDAD